MDLEKKISQLFQKCNWKLKTLEDISTGEIFYGDKKITQNSFVGNGSLPAIVIPDILETQISISKCRTYIDETFKNKRPFIEKTDVVITISDFLLNNLAQGRAYLGDDKCLAGDGLVVIKSKQNPKHLAYMMSSKSVRDQVKLLHRPGVRLKLHKEDIQQITIPIPEISMQNEIVKVLDRWIYLKQTMTNELESIRKQYEFYKEAIFSTL